jgi:glycogen operon protein
MLLHGDELGRTQRGNNNAYCQDNAVSWIDWGSVDHGLLEFTGRVLAIRREQPVLRRRQFYRGRVGRGYRRKDILWFGPDGVEMEDEDWGREDRRSLGMLLNGDLIPDDDSRGRRIHGDTLLVMLHAHPEDTLWRLPRGWGERWELLLDTATAVAGRSSVYEAGAGVPVAGRSLVVLRRSFATPPA